MTVAQIPGVETINDTSGELTQVTIDLRQHPEAIPVLKELGLLPKSQFDIDFENSYTLDEVEAHLTNIVKQHYADKRKAPGL